MGWMMMHEKTKINKPKIERREQLSAIRTVDRFM
jgi:hypothetical protein